MDWNGAEPITNNPSRRTLMPADFIPRADAAYAPFSATFCQKILADWDRYGVSEELAIECAAKQAVFAEAFRAIREPATRTPPALAAKRAARKESERVLRVVASFVRSARTVT